MKRRTNLTSTAAAAIRRRSPARRRIAAGIAACAAALALAFITTTAVVEAAVSHRYASSFTSPGPRAIAVDESSGSVYVLDNATIRKFDASGAPSAFSALGTNRIEAGPFVTTWRQIAVDNSGGINDGVIYVGLQDEQAEVYLPSGEFAASIRQSSFLEDHPNAGGPGDFCAVAVDPRGDLYIGHPNANFGGGSYIDRFHPGQWVANSVSAQLWPITATMGGLRHQPGIEEGFCKIAVDSLNSIYLSKSTAAAADPLKKYPASVLSLSQPPSKTIDSSTTSFAVDTSDDDLYSDRGDSIARFDSTGHLLEEVGTAEFAGSAGVAVDGQTGTLYVSSPAANEIRIYKAAITPDIEDISASTGQTGASVSATVTPAGSATVTGCQVEYGSSTAYGSLAPCAPDPSATPFSDSTEVTASLSGLAKESTYHYRLLVANPNGTTETVDRTLTTHNVADLRTGDATEITQTTATLNASFLGDGDATSLYFEWGPTTSYGNLTAPFPGQPAGAPQGPAAVSAPITGLSVYGPDSSPYHYRVVATNSAGTTVGPDRTFTSAPPSPPAISDVSASLLTPTSAKLAATINPGNGDTLYTFEYGPDPSYGSFSPIGGPIGPDAGDLPVSWVIAGLAPAETYHYRVVAFNFGATTHGPDQTFSTPGLPKVDLSSVTGVTQTTAHLTAQVAANASPTNVRFDYGSSNDYGQSTSATPLAGADLLDHEVAADLSGLAPATTYHFRVVASNPIGAGVGVDQVFTTDPAPTPVGSKPAACKKRFVKRHGKCVRRRKKKNR
jgi:hypothetical protein